MMTVSSNFNSSETQPENLNEWNYFFFPHKITYFDEKETKTSKERANRIVLLKFNYVFGNLRMAYLISLVIMLPILIHSIIICSGVYH